MRMERKDAFEDVRQAGLEAGRKLGFEEGCSLMLTLMAKMTADGLNDELSRLSSDPEFYQKMMRKYLKYAYMQRRRKAEYALNN